MNLRILSVMAIFLLHAACSGTREPGASGNAADASSQQYVEAERIPPAELEALRAGEAVDDQSFRGGTLRVNGKALEVRNAAGTLIASNPRMIRLRDEGGDCPSEGFSRIVVNGDYFTVEQQTCGGMFFVNEYVTFKAGADGSIYLHKFGIVKTDRSDPDRAIPAQVLTPADFGDLRLQDADADRLYGLFKADPEQPAEASIEDTLAAP